MVGLYLCVSQIVLNYISDDVYSACPRSIHLQNEEIISSINITNVFGMKLTVGKLINFLLLSTCTYANVDLLLMKGSYLYIVFVSKYLNICRMCNLNFYDVLIRNRHFALIINRQLLCHRNTDLKPDICRFRTKLINSFLKLLCLESIFFSL